MIGSMRAIRLNEAGSIRPVKPWFQMAQGVKMPNAQYAQCRIPDDKVTSLPTIFLPPSSSDRRSGAPVSAFRFPLFFSAFLFPPPIFLPGLLIFLPCPLRAWQGRRFIVRFAG